MQDELPEYFNIGVGSAVMEIFRFLINTPDNPWWDDPSTTNQENMEDIFRITFEQSYQELKKEQGKDPQDWKWGDLHTITFENQVMDNFPIIKTAFNRGPFPSSGGNDIVNATGWDPSVPYIIDWLPSMRMIVDLSDLSNSLTINTTGQSGHAYHSNYINMADMWRTIQYHPVLWESSTIQEQAEATLILKP
jgi:penicillin amidase